MSNTALTTGKNDSLTAQLAPVVSLWADHVTDANTPRRLDILRDKSNAVLDFFSFTGKAPAEVTPLDVKTWQAELEARGLAPATVYTRVSRVSSFYKWAIEHEQATHNPVTLPRPKRAKPYQTEATQALADDEIIALLRVVKTKADSGDIVRKRDYALLLLYLTTGMRRREVIQLSWGDVKINDIITLATKVKGDEYISREVSNPSVKAALLDYLESSGRLAEMSPDSPLWTAHDTSGKNTGKSLTSHGFVYNLKRYAEQAGLGDIHLHQTRHTFALMVSEESGSIVETQHALGHKNAATTRVYIQRIGVKKGKHGSRIAARLGL
ncbi:MAG: tyrosine-type recombinase/integrase [Anaerolineae bacterium]|nr:tyrosine-type recombinase/integrase [Anaerolineae bacterium]